VARDRLQARRRRVRRAARHTRRTTVRFTAASSPAAIDPPTPHTHPKRGGVRRRTPPPVLPREGRRSTRRRGAPTCRCGGALVDPPIAVATRIALRNAARVRIADGRRSSRTSSTARRPVRYLQSEQRPFVVVVVDQEEWVPHSRRVCNGAANRCCRRSGPLSS
jgi:hypothetical protein